MAYSSVLRGFGESRSMIKIRASDPLVTNCRSDHQSASKQHSVRNNISLDPRLVLVLLTFVEVELLVKLLFPDVPYAR